MGVEKNGRYFEKMEFMSILVLMIDVMIRAFVFIFFKPETDGCRWHTDVLYTFIQKYIGYVQTRYDNT